MKRNNLIAAVVVVSMLFSFSGCDSDNKAVLLKADEYAEAVASFKSGDIASLMVESDGIKDEFEIHDHRFKNLYKAIAGSISYEVDKKSVKSSKKNEEAHADITFTMVDYEEVYSEVFENGGDLEEYIAAIEEDGGKHTSDVTVTVDLVFENEKWLVKDDGFSDLHTIYGFMDDVPEYSWCNFKCFSEEEFQEILFKSVDVNVDYYERNEFSGGVELDYFPGNYMITYHKYNDPADAKAEFDRFFNCFDEMTIDIEDYVFREYLEDEGYLTINNLRNEDGSDYFTYGGYYYKEDTVIYALTFTDYVNEHEIIDSFLKEAGLPLPN